MSAPVRPFERERESLVLHAFVDLADSLVDDYDPLDFLYRLLDHSIPLTQAAAGAVFLHYEGSLHLVASSDAKAESVGVLTVHNGEGPAFEAFTRGEIVTSPDSSDLNARWPTLAKEIASFGWAATFAVPLRLRDNIVGSFIMFWPESEQARPTQEDKMALRAFADVASIAVLQQRETSLVEAVNLQLHHALESRIRVEQVKGMIAVGNSVSVGEAFDILRRYARSHSKRVTDVCRDLIAGDLEISAMTADVVTMRPRVAKPHVASPRRGSH